MTEETGHRVDVNGINLYYEKIGNGRSILLLLPGFCGTSRTDFTALLGDDGLSKSKFTLIAWDPPGYGNSRPPERNYVRKVYENDADLAAEMMKAIGYKLYSVLGWSDGGKTALFLTSKYPSVVDKVVVWGVVTYPIPQYNKNFFATKNFTYWDAEMKAGYDKEYGKEEFEKMYKGLVDGMANGNFLTGPLVPNGILKKIHCPCLVLHGGRDPFVARECADCVVDNVSDSQLHLFPKASHNPHIQFTKEFVKVVTNFLNE